MPITKEQRKALKRVYDRTPLGISYKAFRKTVQRAFGDCLMVHWGGMWLGIEEDGYTHS